MKAMGGSVPSAVREVVDLWNGVHVYDDVLDEPDAVRAAILGVPAQCIDFGGGQVFHGIRLLPADALVPFLGALRVFAAGMSIGPFPPFARQSPAGQLEPNDVHSDAGHGQRTALLYLNPTPADCDGTVFWQRKATGAVRGPWDADCEADSHDRSAWAPWRTVDARYNRLLLFEADYFHGRRIVENYGAGDEARLIVVAFLTRPALEVLGDA
jgi:hypothetical protein